MKTETDNMRADWICTDCEEPCIMKGKDGLPPIRCPYFCNVEFPNWKEVTKGK